MQPGYLANYDFETVYDEDMFLYGYVTIPASPRKKKKKYTDTKKKKIEEINLVNEWSDDEPTHTQPVIVVPDLSNYSAPPCDVDTNNTEEELNTITLKLNILKNTNEVKSVKKQEQNQQKTKPKKLTKEEKKKLKFQKNVSKLTEDMNRYVPN